MARFSAPEARMLDASKLERYRQLGALLVKYGRRDFLEAVSAEIGDDIASVDANTEFGRGPEDLVSDLTELGPTFVKLGQMLSTRADLLSQPYLDALATLQDDVEAIPVETAQALLTEELGVKPSKVFATFEKRPLAAASLGQVHRATLHDGKTVVVKIQRPNIRQQIAEDLEILETLTSAIDRHTEFGRQYELTRLVGQFKAALMEELDYRQEAQNLVTLGEALAGHSEIVVPAPVHDLVTSRVLVMDYVEGRSVSSLGPLARMEAEIEPLARVLCEAYLDQIVVEGLVHCDPHPGNVLVTNDNRLGLIDLGMVTQIEADFRERLLRVLLALCEGRGRDVAELALEFGERRADANIDGFIEAVSELVTKRARLPRSERKLGMSLLRIVSIFARNGIRPPVEISLLGKTLLLLDEVARTLDPDFDPDAVFENYAHRLVRQRFTSGFDTANVMGRLLEANRFVQRTPRQLERIFESLARGEMRFRVESIDEARLLTSLERIGNRITVGLILSALIVGGALLMRVDTPWTLLGYPALAIVLFLAAALIGFGLVVQVVFAERRENSMRRKRTRRR
ncbi:MAG TPA: AarF/UbiB family protein [Gammaproteobacteria bacterium]|nr:AarF/UbiB family protein [Gammaproteobacteria bacterium]